MGEEMTVEKLYRLLKRVVESGHGGMPVRIQDSVLHDDEISFYYTVDEHMEMKGMLYNVAQFDKIIRFREDVEKAWERMKG